MHVDIAFDVKIRVEKIKLEITNPSSNFGIWYIISLKGKTTVKV